MIKIATMGHIIPLIAVIVLDAAIFLYICT